MCAPGYLEHLKETLSRRSFLKAVSAGLAAATLAPAPAQARPFPPFTRIVDLTHTHGPEFPTYLGKPGVALKQVFELRKDGFNLMEWTVLEHSGTHIDAPIHFSEGGAGPEALAVERLVVPLAVIDVRHKAAGDPDYRVTPADISAWERRHGRLTEGACVAMNSGWDEHVHSERFAGRDDKGVLHFPGFHPETAELLLKDRNIAGIAVDTLSLDHGPSKDFKTHHLWLSSGRWGLENVANLGRLPQRGATLVVGAPKIKGATGGPTRLFALL
jgi:kynurenine formamidase